MQKPLRSFRSEGFKTGTRISREVVAGRRFELLTFGL